MVFLSVVFVLLSLHCTLLTLYFLFPEHNIRVVSDYFDFGIEGNVPTFYSAVALLCCAGVLALIARRRWHTAGGHRGYWLGLAMIFVYLALDEATAIHEWASDIMDNFMTGEGLLYYLWVVPYGAVLCGIALAYLPFVRALRAATRRRVIGAGAIYVTGALGFEMIGASAADRYGSTDTVTYTVLYTIEETLEMVGIVLFLHALLRELAAQTNVITLKLVSRASEARSEHAGVTSRAPTGR